MEQEKKEKGREGEVERQLKEREREVENTMRRDKGQKRKKINEMSYFFFFNDTATTEIYTLSLHDALPIS